MATIIVVTVMPPAGGARRPRRNARPLPPLAQDRHPVEELARREGELTAMLMRWGLPGGASTRR
jgi:hypothetical protein